MAKLIRKISVGKDYKNDAMHYAVGQEVYGGHTICDIIEEEDKFSVYIRKGKNIACTQQSLTKIGTTKKAINMMA